MELTEEIESLNRQLIDLFGIDTISGNPIWRIVWADDQREKRLTECTDTGIFLLTPEVRELPKYTWILHKYLLERLVPIPDISKGDLPGRNLSYEPMFTFEDRRGNYLPPRLDVAKIVIDSVYAAQGKTSLAKYNDPEINPETKLKRVTEIQDYLFGEESDVTDAMAHGEAIVVPQNYTKES